MKPVAMVRFDHSEGPGYFAIHHERSSVPWQLVRIDVGKQSRTTRRAAAASGP